MNVALYARVSTADQDCELQLSEMRSYCTARGWADRVEYVDTGWSGSKASRPRLDALMRDCRLRKVDCVLVWKLDRWGRSVQHAVTSIGELSSLGVRFVAITQGLDTDQSNPMSRFLLHIMAAFAEMEREMIRERVMAGLQVARKKGKQLGRRPRVFDRDRVVQMRDEQAMSWREIGRALKIAPMTALDAYRERKGEAQ